jgi:transcriptional regulator with XRE-family HTH domain
MNLRKRRFFNRLSKKEYRDALVESAIGDTIAVQLKKLREKSGLHQSELAAKANMAQPRIAVLENPDYDKYTLNTLKRLASALDVGLIVRFAPFGEVDDWVTGFSPQSADVPTFKEEAVSLENGKPTTTFELTIIFEDVEPHIYVQKENIKIGSQAEEQAYIIDKST